MLYYITVHWRDKERTLYVHGCLSLPSLDHICMYVTWPFLFLNRAEKMNAGLEFGFDIGWCEAVRKAVASTLHYR